MPTSEGGPRPARRFRSSRRHGYRTVLIQIVNIAGAFLILGAYAANQRGWIGPPDRSYNLMNVVGALLLLWVAIVDVRWGFIILEAVWAAVSVPRLIRPPERPRPAGP